MSFNYTILLNSKITLAVYILLSFSIVSLWFRRDKLILGSLFGIAVLMALYSHRLYWQGLLFIGVFGGVNYLAFNSTHKFIRILSSFFVLIGSIFLWFHWAPGFTNWQVANSIQMSIDAVPFNMFLNFDKPLIGLFILAFSGIPLLRSWRAWRNMAKNALPAALIGSITIAGIACLAGYVQYEPKMNTFFILWALNNLLLVCVAEEVLFRGWIQGSLNVVLKRYPYGNYLALIIASVLFGLMHSGGWIYVALATFAGLFYGAVYQKTKSVEASIITHFTLNALHFIGFTYPALASKAL